MQYIFDVKIGIELPFRADAHLEGEYQMDVLTAIVQTRYQQAGQDKIMDCLDKLHVGPLDEMDQSLVMENLVQNQIGSVCTTMQSTLESELIHI